MLFVRLCLLGSSDGASVCASAALDAGISVDYILSVALRNSFNGALCCASAAGDAIVRNYICHFSCLLITFFLIVSHDG